MTNDLEQARREAAEMLGLDPDKLSPGARLRCELVASLRAVVDDELGKVTSSRSSDLGKLIIAIETLSKYLADAKPQAEAGDPSDDPHARLMKIIDNWIANHAAEKAERAAQRAAQGLDALPDTLEPAHAEIERLRGNPDALKFWAAPESEHTITPSESDIVPPNEQPGRNLRKQIGADDYKVMRPKPTIDAVANPPTPLQVWAAECERIEQLRQQYAPQAEPWQPAKPNCPAVAKPGWLTRIERDLANSRRALDHQIMTAPSRVSGEPQPSNGTESWRFPQAAFRREW
jgi:hypothetical protein